VAHRAARDDVGGDVSEGGTSGSPSPADFVAQLRAAAERMMAGWTAASASAAGAMAGGAAPAGPALPMLPQMPATLSAEKMEAFLADLAARRAQVQALGHPAAGLRRTARHAGIGHAAVRGVDAHVGGPGEDDDGVPAAAVGSLGAVAPGVWLSPGCRRPRRTRPPERPSSRASGGDGQPQQLGGVPAEDAAFVGLGSPSARTVSEGARSPSSNGWSVPRRTCPTPTSSTRRRSSTGEKTAVS
jgi:hypothetical protein